MHSPTFGRETICLFTLAAMCASILLSTPAAAINMGFEQPRFAGEGNGDVSCGRMMQPLSSGNQGQVPCQDIARKKALQRRPEQALQEERSSEQRAHEEQVRDQRVHDERVHEERVREERLHEERLHDERVREQRLREARSHSRR